MGVLKHAAACRSMPQRAKIFTWRTFFFITCQTCEPFVAQVSQNWSVAQWSTYWFPFWRVLGSIPGKGNVLPVSSSPLCFFGVVLTYQVLRILKLPRHHRFLKPVPLSENDGTLDQHLEACRSMPQHAAACRSEPKFSWGPLAWQWELGHHVLRVAQPPDGSLKSPDAHSIKHLVAAEPEVSDTLSPEPATPNMLGGVTPLGYVAAGMSLFPVDRRLHRSQTDDQKVHKRNISLLVDHLKSKFQILGIDSRQLGFQCTKLFSPMKDNAIINESAQWYALVQPYTVFTHSQNESGPPPYD